jgi:hypothetical protein
VLSGLPLCKLGLVTGSTPTGGAATTRLVVRGLDDSVVIDAALAGLKAAWQRPLRWS